MNNTTYMPYILPAARGLMFFLIQAVIAAIFFSNNSPNPWDSSTAWWSFSVTTVNIIYLTILIHQYKIEGLKYTDIFKINTGTLKSDLIALLLLFIIMAPASMVPNIFLGNLIFGNQQTALDLFLKPLPFWGIAGVMLLFPVTQGLVELAVYFIYAMPRIATQSGSRSFALIYTSILLSLQHIAVPFVFHQGFIIWRGLMFLPFAFIAGGVLLWRPRLFPYLAIIHCLMDASLGIMYITGGLLK
jgi:hypothetical protein